MLTLCIESSIVPPKPKGLKENAIDGVMPSASLRRKWSMSCSRALTLWLPSHIQNILPLNTPKSLSMFIPRFQGSLGDLLQFPCIVHNKNITNHVTFMVFINQTHFFYNWKLTFNMDLTTCNGNKRHSRTLTWHLEVGSMHKLSINYIKLVLCKLHM